MLGLISTTRQGAELLEELGWIATRTATGKTTGICLPNDVSRFVRVRRSDHIRRMSADGARRLSRGAAQRCLSRSRLCRL